MSAPKSIAFTVYGQPVPKGRPRVYGKRTITPPRTAAYEQLVRLSARVARRHVGRWPIDARYSVQIAAYFGDARARDLDNVAKAVLDAMNGELYADDSAIDELHIRRELDRANPRVDVRVSIREAA